MCDQARFYFHTHLHFNYPKAVPKDTMSTDDVVLLNNGDDDDSTVFQSEKDREDLLKQILDEDDDVTEIDTTLSLAPHRLNQRTYWQSLFG